MNFQDLLKILTLVTKIPQLGLLGILDKAYSSPFILKWIILANAIIISYSCA